MESSFNIDLLAQQVAQKIQAAGAITILTHLNPDPDTLGTGLGIFNLLKQYTNKRIEIVNASKEIPLYLDFLPSFNKIKSKMDFDKSLIIACDGGTIDRFGFEISEREIINIDHHFNNTHYGAVNVVIPEYASASQVAYRLFEKIYTPIPSSAVCFYTALLSDTRYFTTSSVNYEVFKVATEMVALGVDPAKVATNFTQRRSLASLRILERALHSLVLYFEGKIAVLTITPEDIDATGATMPDMDGIVDYARSLAIVEVAILIIALTDGSVRISLRSKGADVAKVAAAFGGGGHKVAAGFTLMHMQTQEIIDTILEKISILGLIDGKEK